MLTLEDIEQTELKLNDKIEVNEVLQLEIPKFNTDIFFSSFFTDPYFQKAGYEEKIPDLTRIEKAEIQRLGAWSTIKVFLFFCVNE